MGTIKAIAHLNELTKDVKNDYYLLHQPRGTLYSKDIHRRMELKQIATNNVNGEAYVRKFFEECILAVGEGYNVVTELFQLTIGIRGVVYTQNLGRNIPAEQVNVRMNFVQSAEARQSIRDITVYVAEQPAPAGPFVQNVANPLTGETGVLNTGDMVLVQGMRIAVRGDKADETGVYFTPVDGGESIRVAAERISPNTPSKLQFVLPAAVTPGEWRVAVATQASGNLSNQTEHVRRYEYPEIITVI